MHWPFPPWTNKLRELAGVIVVGGAVYATVLIWFGFSPEATDVGYQPQQPVAFSHALHAGELGLDCRYCHQTVERAAHAAIPTTETCMGCHERIHPESKKLLPVRESWASGEAIPWVRVHDLPDYAYFDHSAHIQSGVGCASCHGRIDQMDVVFQSKPLSMGWCLDCHRDPAPHIRPKEWVTKMDWEQAEKTMAALPHHVNASEDCSTCHR